MVGSVGSCGFGGFRWVQESSCPRQRSPRNPRNPLTSVCLNAQFAATLPIEPIELIEPMELVDPMTPVCPPLIFPPQQFAFYNLFA